MPKKLEKKAKKRKSRPPRVFYDNKKNKPYVILSGKRVYLKGDGISNEQLVRVVVNNFERKTKKSRKKKRRRVTKTGENNSLTGSISSSSNPKVDSVKDLYTLLIAYQRQPQKGPKIVIENKPPEIKALPALPAPDVKEREEKKRPPLMGPGNVRFTPYTSTPIEPGRLPRIPGKDVDEQLENYLEFSHQARDPGITPQQYQYYKDNIPTIRKGLQGQRSKTLTNFVNIISDNLKIKKLREICNRALGKKLGFGESNNYLYYLYDKRYINDNDLESLSKIKDKDAQAYELERIITNASLSSSSSSSSYRQPPLASAFQTPMKTENKVEVKTLVKEMTRQIEDLPEEDFEGGLEDISDKKEDEIYGIETPGNDLEKLRSQAQELDDRLLRMAGTQEGTAALAKDIENIVQPHQIVKEEADEEDEKIYETEEADEEDEDNKIQRLIEMNQRENKKSENLMREIAELDKKDKKDKEKLRTRRSLLFTNQTDFGLSDEEVQRTAQNIYEIKRKQGVPHDAIKHLIEKNERENEKSIRLLEEDSELERKAQQAKEIRKKFEAKHKVKLNIRVLNDLAEGLIDINWDEPDPSKALVINQGRVEEETHKREQGMNNIKQDYFQSTGETMPDHIAGRIHDGDYIIEYASGKIIDNSSKVVISDFSSKRKRGKGSSSSSDGMYDDEITKILNKYKNKGFAGVYSIDEVGEIPVGNRKNIGFVVNLSPSYQKGSHWVAVYISIDDDMSVEYYDSFANDPPKRLLKELKKLIDKMNPEVYLKFKINKIIQQRANGGNCGWWSIYHLLNRFNGIPFKDCTRYSDVIQSERKIEKFKHRFGYI